MKQNKPSLGLPEHTPKLFSKGSRLLSDRRLESEMTMQEEISSSGSDIESNPDQGLMMRINDQIGPVGSQMDSQTTSQKDIVKV